MHVAVAAVDVLMISHHVTFLPITANAATGNAYRSAVEADWFKLALLVHAAKHGNSCMNCAVIACTF